MTESWLSSAGLCCAPSGPQDGQRFFKMPEAYIRGNTLKYISVPEEVCGAQSGVCALGPAPASADLLVRAARLERLVARSPYPPHPSAARRWWTRHKRRLCGEMVRLPGRLWLPGLRRLNVQPGVLSVRPSQTRASCSQPHQAPPSTVHPSHLQRSALPWAAAGAVAVGGRWAAGAATERRARGGAGGGEATPAEVRRGLRASQCTRRRALCRAAAGAILLSTARVAPGALRRRRRARARARRGQGPLVGARPVSALAQRDDALGPRRLAGCSSSGHARCEALQRCSRQHCVAGGLLHNRCVARVHRPCAVRPCALRQGRIEPRLL
jgi:hypothetical protein